MLEASKKPEKESWYRFYVLTAYELLAEKIDAVWNWLLDRPAAIRARLGWWYCHGCNKEHSPRTVIYYRPTKYWLSFENICSLHKQEKPE